MLHLSIVSNQVKQPDKVQTEMSVSYPAFYTMKHAKAERPKNENAGSLQNLHFVFQRYKINFAEGE